MIDILRYSKRVSIFFYEQFGAGGLPWFFIHVTSTAMGIVVIIPNCVATGFASIIIAEFMPTARLLIFD